MLFKKAINDCNSNTKWVSTLVKLMEKCYWASFIIDNVKWTSGLRTSSISESNHNSVIFLFHRIWTVSMVLCNNWRAANTNKCYKIMKLVFHKVLDDQTIFFSTWKISNYNMFTKIKTIHIHVISPILIRCNLNTIYVSIKT